MLQTIQQAHFDLFSQNGSSPRVSAWVEAMTSSLMIWQWRSTPSCSFRGRAVNLRRATDHWPSERTLSSLRGTLLSSQFITRSKTCVTYPGSVWSVFFFLNFGRGFVWSRRSSDLGFEQFINRPLTIWHASPAPCFWYLVKPVKVKVLNWCVITEYGL